MGKAKIAVIDYGCGNIKSVLDALAFCGAQSYVINSPGKISEYDGAILPGVGSFGPAAGFLRETGFDKAICEYSSCGKMIFGICLGFQLLFTTGFENGRYPGLNLIKGEVRKFPCGDGRLKIPHTGWNKISITESAYAAKMFSAIDDKENFYFVHSYYAMPSDREKASSFCGYGTDFCSSVAWKNIWGSQFHPEKSGEKGLKILSNFINEVKKR